MVDLLIGANEAVEGLVGQAADGLGDVAFGKEVRLSLDFDAVVPLQPRLEDAGQHHLVEAAVAHCQRLVAAQVLPAKGVQDLDGGDFGVEVFEVREFH